MSFEFPYHFLQFDNVSVPYPMVTATLSTFLGRHPYSFVMDTGADVTTLPNYMIAVLGLDRSALEETESTGVGGKTKSYNAEITITIKKLTFTLPVTFVENNAIPLLLGKEGIFDRFNIVFDNDAKKTILHVR